MTLQSTFEWTKEGFFYTRNDYMYTDPVCAGAGTRTDLLQSKRSRGTTRIAWSLLASALCLSIYSLALGPK